MFDIETGVRPGCSLPPLLFLITIDDVMTKTMDDANFGIEWDQKRLADLDFAYMTFLRLVKRWQEYITTT